MLTSPAMRPNVAARSSLMPVPGTPFALVEQISTRRRVAPRAVRCVLRQHGRLGLKCSRDARPGAHGFSNRNLSVAESLPADPADGIRSGFFMRTVAWELLEIELQWQRTRFRDGGRDGARRTPREFAPTGARC
jgi:hypothetical protein